MVKYRIIDKENSTFKQYSETDRVWFEYEMTD